MYHHTAVDNWIMTLKGTCIALVHSPRAGEVYNTHLLSRIYREAYRAIKLERALVECLRECMINQIHTSFNGQN